jgi:hypothetical protein
VVRVLVCVLLDPTVLEEMLQESHVLLDITVKKESAAIQITHVLLEEFAAQVLQLLMSRFKFVMIIYPGLLVQSDLHVLQVIIALQVQ